jgi:hypothetical protein
VIAAGSASEIVDLGDGRVLRRFKEGGRRAWFTQLFLRHVDRQAARQTLPDAVAFRLADPNVTDAERTRVAELLR